MKIKELELDNFQYIYNRVTWDEDADLGYMLRRTEEKINELIEVVNTLNKKKNTSEVKVRKKLVTKEVG